MRDATFSFIIFTPSHFVTQVPGFSWASLPPSSSSVSQSLSWSHQTGTALGEDLHSRIRHNIIIWSGHGKDLLTWHNIGQWMTLISVLRQSLTSDTNLLITSATCCLNHSSPQLTPQFPSNTLAWSPPSKIQQLHSVSSISNPYRENKNANFSDFIIS